MPIPPAGEPLIGSARTGKQRQQSDTNGRCIPYAPQPMPFLKGNHVRFSCRHKSAPSIDEKQTDGHKPGTRIALAPGGGPCFGHAAWPRGEVLESESLREGLCRLTEYLKTAMLIPEGQEPLADAEHEKSRQSW